MGFSSGAAEILDGAITSEKVNGNVVVSPLHPWGEKGTTFTLALWFVGPQSIFILAVPWPMLSSPPSTIQW